MTPTRFLIQEDHYAGERPNYLVLTPGGCSWVATRRLATVFGPPQRQKAIDLARTSTRRAIREVPAPLEAWEILEGLRERGWSVAVHNDYRIHGQHMTFWLLRRGDFAAKGEGPTDVDALEEASNEAARIEHDYNLEGG